MEEEQKQKQQKKRDLHIYPRINAVREFQEFKHPKFPDHMRMAILAEEVGEVGKALQDGNRAELIHELLDVAATAIRWIETLIINEE